MTIDQLYPDGVRDVVFFHDCTSPRDTDTLHIRRFTGTNYTDLKFSEEITRLELDEPQTRTLVSRVVKAMLEQWANPKAQQFFYGTMWSSALLAMRKYGMDKAGAFPSALFQKTLLATVIYQGGHDKYTRGLVLGILPNPEDNSTRQDAINYLLEMECTEDEVREAWIEMLRTRQREKFLTTRIVEWWQDLKIGKNDLRKEVEPIAQALILYELKDALVGGCFDWNNPQYTSYGTAPEDFLKIMDFLVSSSGYDWYTKNEEARDLVESYFVECLARGKVGTAFYMLVRYGKKFGLCKWDDHGGKDWQTDQQPNAVMERLMRAAIAKAEERNSYGIATALAEHIGEIEKADSWRNMARHLHQIVALDVYFYHTSK